MNLIQRTILTFIMTLAALLPKVTLAEESLNTEPFKTCILACQECTTACESCATACLNESKVNSRVTCIQLCRDCADTCNLASQVMARSSTHANKVCALCADICQACADECIKLNMAHGQKCAEACQKCADRCKKMAE
jgi:hypothetical protein